MQKPLFVDFGYQNLERKREREIARPTVNGWVNTEPIIGCPAAGQEPVPSSFVHSELVQQRKDRAEAFVGLNNDGVAVLADETACRWVRSLKRMKR